MFGIGMPELIVILVIGLIILGPKKLPDLAKSLGKAFVEFKKATSDFKQAMEFEELNKVKKSFNEMNTEIQQAISQKPEEKPLTPTESPESSPQGDELKKKESVEIIQPEVQAESAGGKDNMDKIPILSSEETKEMTGKISESVQGKTPVAEEKSSYSA